MSLYLKIILIIFGLAYLISPVDIIPDLLVPYIGWLDDGAIIATLVYLIRYGRLPGFMFKQKGKANPSHGKKEDLHKKIKSPHEILGVPPTASKSQIKDAYKAAIKKYHPDKLSHLGEEFSDLANEKFVEIQDAYDSLMKNHRA